MPSVYDRVPKPKYIQRLPMIGSMPVPYTTKYADADTGDVPEFFFQDALGNDTQGCSCKFGVGKALLGNPCAQRQHKAMKERRCVNCGRVIGDKAELVFIGVANKNLGAEGLAYSIEPPSHAECAAYSILVCPKLVEKADVITLALSRTYHLAAQVTNPGIIGKPGQRLTPIDDRIALGEVIDLYAAIPDPDTAKFVSLDEWMRTRAPRVYRELYVSGALRDMAR